MKPDLPIIGEKDKSSNSLLTVSLWQSEMERMLAGAKVLEDRRKIHELRKSCGVEDTQIGIKVNVPPRYHP